MHIYGSPRLKSRTWQVTACQWRNAFDKSQIVYTYRLCVACSLTITGNGDLGWSARLVPTPPRNCQENALSLTTNHPDMVRKQCFFVPNGSSTVSLGIHTILAGHAASVRSLALQRVFMRSVFTACPKNAKDHQRIHTLHVALRELYKLRISDIISLAISRTSSKMRRSVWTKMTLLDSNLTWEKALINGVMDQVNIDIVGKWMFIPSHNTSRFWSVPKEIGSPTGPLHTWPQATVLFAKALVFHLQLFLLAMEPQLAQEEYNKKDKL